jgi:hypothetical protein
MRSRSAAVCLILVAVSFLGLRKVRAQLSEIQPFTAVETSVFTSTQQKTPRVHSGMLAVSSDGQKFARVATQGVIKQHFIYDKTNQKTTLKDTETKMLVDYEYEDITRSLTAGAHCEGTPDGQIEGFYVNLIVQHGTGIGKGGTSVTKSWAAPKLGCYILRREETVTDANGTVLMTFEHTLSSIKLGEPDQAYFDASLPEGYTAGKQVDLEGAKANLHRQE